MNNTYLDQLLGKVPEGASNTLINNWQAAFVWLAVGVIIFALVALYLGLKRVSKGEDVNKGMLPYVKWPLLFASAGFNVFFTYYVFEPAGQAIALFAAIVMGGVNLAEAYLVRLIIATWRHDMKLVFKLALCFTIPVFAYSLMAAGSSFTTMMKKNKDGLAASQLQLQAAQDTIKAANSVVKEAEAGQQNGLILASLYQTPVRNSQGREISFAQVKASCDRGGYYSIHYPELCQQYKSHRNGSFTASSVASANTQAFEVAANKKIEMAQIIKDRPPEITPTLLGFALGLGAVGFIVSLALESAIVGVGFFEELFIKPTPLPGIVSFMNKALDWDAESITQRGLQVDISPSPGTVKFSGAQGAMASPFSSVGWSPQSPHFLPQNALIATQQNTPVIEPVAPVKTHVSKRTDTQENAPVSSENTTVSTGNAPVPSNTGNALEEQKKMVTLLQEMKDRNTRAEQAKIGEGIECVTCGTETEKRIETKRFCSSPCRLQFHKIKKQYGKKRAGEKAPAV